MLTNLTMQRQSPSGLESLPSDTVANMRGDMKAITTQSGVAYDGPSIPPTSSSFSKEVEREPEVTTDKDLGASINIMPLSVWKKISLPELTPTRMTLKLANRSVAYLVGVAEDVFVKVGKFHFLADFVVVDYDVDPRVPLILGRPFLRMTRALIDVHSEELTLQVNDEAITFKEYAQEVFGFLDSSTSGNPTPSNPIVASSSPSFTPFEGGDFILEEIKTFLCTPDELYNLDNDYYDTKGDILYLEKLLNKDPSSNHPLMKNKDLKQVDVTMTMPSIEEPSELELKDLPPHLEYSFLEGTDKLPDDFKPAVQHQRRVNPKIYEVIKKEVIKLLDTGLIYPIVNSPWEKCHFMVKEGIVLRHKISKSGIEVDRAKVNFIAKLPHSTSVKGAVLGKRKTKHFQPIHYASKTMTDAQAHYTTTEKEVLAVVGQVEVLNRGLKRILERTVDENRALWSDKLDDVLWAFRTAFKTPIGCTPYKLVYGKAYYLPIELEYKAYLALKYCNFDLKSTSNHRKVQMNELNQLRDQAYENSLIYKERTKKIHDSKIKNRIFSVGDRVLLFNYRLKILSGKLKTRWTRPFIVTQVLAYGTVELSQTDGPKLKVNWHRLKHYFGGDIPPMVVPNFQTFPMNH
nr:reverse transcriptase domain-containing protein [Tanacetum cinerariifolium]